MLTTGDPPKLGALCEEIQYIKFIVKIMISRQYAPVITPLLHVGYDYAPIIVIPSAFL